MRETTVGFSKLCLGPTVGTGFKNLEGVAAVVRLIVRGGFAQEGHAPGQFTCQLHDVLLDACKLYVTCGDARRTSDPEDYINRKHWSGKIVQCLPRHMAGETNKILVIFSTREAYLADPDVLADPVETARIQDEMPDYVVVWVVASGGNTDMPGDVFLRNLAGANNNEAKMSGDEIRAQAVKSVARDLAWCTVAD